MEIFDLHHLHVVVGYLHEHPHTGGLIAFAIAFLESVALIGGLVPGSVIMTAIGALIGSGAMPLLATILWAIAGAFVGDVLSYGIGAYYNERLRNMWPFRKHPQWLATGQDFFARHGGKSVLIGRFFGPMRGLVPLIAGLLHMPVLRFALADLIAAVLWSILYILPGVIVGALSLELPPATATKFILIVLATVAFGWLIVVLIHLSFKTLVVMADRAMSWLWQWLAAHKATRWVTTLLSDSNKPNQHRQLTLALFTLLCGVLFLWTFYCMVTHSHLAQLNKPVFELLRSLRTRVGDDIMLAATLLGDKHTQLIAGALIFVWLLWKRYGWAALHWLGVILLSAGVATGVKILYYSPRPTGLLHPQLTSSFPSGHTILATALFGFMAMLLAHHATPGRRKAPLLIAGFFVIVVAFSRIYLGAHWLTDVLASLFLGLGCAALMNLSYLRHTSKPLPVAKLSGVVVGIFLLVWIGYGTLQFRTEQENDTLYWPTVSMDTTTWWQQPHPGEVPLFILSRLGKPEAALNVQWLGTLDDIRRMLATQGWQEHEIHLNWKGSLNRLSPIANPEHLPLWPSLYQNHEPVLLMTKPDGPPPLYFILWKSNITFADSPQTLWVGSVHYFIPRPHKGALVTTPEETHQLYEKAITVFVADLHGLNWQIRHISLEDQPAVMWPLHWDGQLLLVK